MTGLHSWTAASTQRRHPRRQRLLVGLAAGLVVVAFGSAGLLGYVGYAYAAVIPAHVQVAGIELGGLTPAAAQTKLQQAIDRVNNEPIKLTLNETTISRTSAELWVDYQPAAT